MKVKHINPDTPWPVAISDGLTLPCADCGQVPAFDYHVTDEFWQKWVLPDDGRYGVVCLPCLGQRCGGYGIAEALMFVQFVGPGVTVELTPTRAFVYAKRPGYVERLTVDEMVERGARAMALMPDDMTGLVPSDGSYAAARRVIGANFPMWLEPVTDLPCEGGDSHA